MSAERSCLSCQFMEMTVDDHDGEPFMQCRRLPPLVAPLDDDLITLFPVVDDQMWCGEFVSRD